MNPEWHIERERVNRSLQLFRKLQAIMLDIEQSECSVPLELIEAIRNNNINDAQYWAKRAENGT